MAETCQPWTKHR